MQDINSAWKKESTASLINDREEGTKIAAPTMTTTMTMIVTTVISTTTEF
jgi:hypothetical protein